MVTVQEGVLGGLAALAAIVYFFVARIQAKRQVSSEARPALVGFIIWWAGLGIVGLTTVFFQFGPALEEQSLLVVRITLYTLFGAIFVMLAGLVHYLLYLYTGQPGGLYVAAGFYILMFLFLVWLVEAHAPHVAAMHEGEPNAGQTGFHLHDEPPTWASLALTGGLLLPPLAATIAYGMLFFRTQDRTARYRIAMVSIGFILWFGFSLFGSIARALAGEADQSFAGRITSQLLGLLAAVLVLMAYDPPRVVRERFGLRSIDDASHGSRQMFDSPPRVQPGPGIPIASQA